jgi:hypothetical protein
MPVRVSLAGAAPGRYLSGRHRVTRYGRAEQASQADRRHGRAAGDPGRKRARAAEPIVSA